ncbi:uncharacterized protein LOC131950428 isoform X2 [Physella acuta]|nr:uncharacterized protein LOC131950428 isoform X2 [Physella acuta]
MLGLGLFSNMLAVRFTCRKVVFVGGILTSIGFIMTAYMPSFWNLYLTYAVTGIGFGLSYSPCVVMVGCHFRKRRSLANGISVSGSGVGSFVLPNIMRVLLDTYDLSGCLLILGAITLNVCACAMLFRPLSSYRPKVKRTKVTEGETNNTEEGRVPTVKCEEDQDHIHREDSTDKDMRNDGVEMEKLLNNNSGNWELYENDKNLALSGSRNLIYKGETNLRKPGMHLLAPDVTSGRLTPSQYASNGDIFMASLQNIPREDMADLNNRCLDLGCLSRPGGSENKTKVKASNKAKVKDPNKPKLFNWSLVTNPVFLMYAFSCVLANFGYPNIFFMLPAFAESNGQDRNSAALLVSIIGITDLLGRFCLGWFSDFNFIPKRFGFIGCIAISAVLNIIVPAMTSFAAMATYAALYGFFGGAFWALIAVLLAEALGVEKLSSSYGLITISMATSLLPGPIICGLIRDATLSWNYAFIFCGIMALIGSVIPIFEPCAQKYLATKEEKKALSKV